ncbi:DUF1763-domain-containing protein [Aspergillus ruber CBS 135680]|uniref:DUF1763-domain-containing protein n=1 Tax=Aspergillus ruber (strain CBS 135680) TaxID=1388766 RepID=A0A017S7J2_ASPRC|nr:DUF1763-domain-containing protein [Aspergillus ruber CBS 135680]EYE92554.1 DUF1763-domain-containing protein [Aspergillus ruber CBS 135680]
MDKRAVVHAYRHLYRQGLKALHYSVPARHVLLKTLRSGFRSSSPNDFDLQRIANTMRFLQQATDVAGLEHKILKNLMTIRYWEQPQVRKNARVLKGIGIEGSEAHARKDANEEFELTLMLLNESLGTCLR